ncbi:MAG: ParB/RepB/Spo0J family partition protein [Methylococcales bacterium]
MIKKNISLNKLVISDNNVRVVQPEKAKDMELIASIKSHGLVQDLVVVEQEKSGCFEVIAGGRRLAALQHLKSKGDIKGTYSVPCAVNDGSNITAISLAENIKATMHPADEFMAYQKMTDEGKSVKDIACEFGVTQTHVKRRLKLAGVAPEIIKVFRDNKISLEVVMAFTVSDSHESQMGCYKELCPNQLHVNRIKGMLLDDTVRDSAGVVKLVTLKAYKKAGGSVICDLFESNTFINNVELLNTLAMDKFDIKRQELLLAGWKWCEIGYKSEESYGRLSQLTAKIGKLPKELSNNLKAKLAEQKLLEDKDLDDWTDEDNEREDALYDEIESLENEQDEYRAFTKKQKSVSGVVLDVDNMGRITLEMGFVKSEDMEAAFPPSKTDLSNSDGGLVGSVEEPIESNALVSDLNNFHLQAIQSVVIGDDDLTYDLMVFSLSRDILGELDWPDRAIDINLRITNLSQTAFIDETESAKALTEYCDSLDVSWLGFESEGDKFNAFRELSRNQKKRILSYCMAIGLNSAGDCEVTNEIKKIVSFDITQHWKPTKENYFSRIKQKQLLEIAKEQIGDEFANEHENSTKGQLVDLLEGRDEMIGWMPNFLK